MSKLFYCLCGVVAGLCLFSFFSTSFVEASDSPTIVESSHSGVILASDEEESDDVGEDDLEGGDEDEQEED